MTLTQNGVDYICQNFGDINECLISDGLEYSYIDIHGNPYIGQIGGTSTIVSALALEIVQTLTMDNPPRGTFTPQQLVNANGGSIGLADILILDAHDENSGEQWCYTVIPCNEGATKCIGNDLYTCQDGEWTLTEQNSPECITIPCSDYPDKESCETNGCYWYSNLPPVLPSTCHSKPEDEMRKYLIYGGIALAGLAVAVLIIKKISGRQPHYPPPQGR